MRKYCIFAVLTLSTNKIVNMNSKILYNEMELIAQNLNIIIKKDKGGFKNGYAVINDSKTILINKNSPVESTAIALAKALSYFKLDDLYVKPAVRLFIETEKEKLKNEEVIEFNLETNAEKED